MAVVWKKLAYAADVSTEIDGDITTHAAIKSANAVLGHVMVETASLIDVDGDGKLTLGAHKDTHDPGGTDGLDTATPTAILEVQAVAEGSAGSVSRSDHAHAIVHDITDNSLVTVDGTPADTEIAVWNAGGLDGETPAEVAARMALDDIGVPDAGVDFDLQEAIDLVVFTVADEAARDALNAAATAKGMLCFATTEASISICTESSV
ncbi:hypothetical protein LCGC14_2181340 [marine sediment metagenome]|uniref:Uncharacterized protein n=1 Tax=marine sediment metagenome TaxID=412755 RepID=A0A0F9GI45_9ZZZZ